MIKVLHLDIEGGWGGSSRSLFETVVSLQGSAIESIVVHRQRGPIEKKYQEIGVKTFFVPGFYSFAPRPQNSWKIFLGSLKSLVHFFKSAKQIIEIAKREKITALHLNYEGLFLLGVYLKWQLKLPMIGHVRTLIPNNFWGKVLSRIYVRVCDRVFCITENELSCLVNNIGSNKKLLSKCEVMYNMLTTAPTQRNSLESLDAVYLGNITPCKGAFKLIEMGKILKENGSKIKINVYGVDRTGKKQHEKFLEEINSNQLEETIVYHGHTSGPEEVLKKSFVLLRLSDDHAPWGRDVIEATTLGVPVIGLGTYEGVVTTGETGFLFEKYKADEVVNRMQLLSEQSDVWLKFHNNSISKGKNLFSGKNQRKQFESLFSSINN